MAINARSQTRDKSFYPKRDKKQYRTGVNPAAKHNESGDSIAPVAAVIPADPFTTSFYNSDDIEDLYDEHVAELPVWEQDNEVIATQPIGVLTWILGGSILGLSIVALSVWFMALSADQAKDLDSEGEPALSHNEQHPEDPVDQAPQLDEFDSLDASKKVVTQFLEAKTAADLEQLVRTPEVTISRLRAWYARYPWVRPGARVAGLSNSIKVVGDRISMNAQLDDFSVKKIHVVRGRDGYKVDWESWVAWSSMAWEDLFDIKPAEPVEVRVKCKRVNYYNRLFDDDARWFAVRLSHPDFESSIYGYIDTKLPQLQRLVTDLTPGSEIHATLKISYPKDSEFSNQVFIVEYVQLGWVRPTLHINGLDNADSN